MKMIPRDSNWEQRVRNSFQKQEFMKLLGAEIIHCTPGMIEISLPFSGNLTQQHGLFHGGVTTSIADSAAGFAALSLYKLGTGVLTSEFKINFLSPAKGKILVARGKVVKPGKTLTICQSDVFTQNNNTKTHVATGLFTFICVDGVED